MRPFEVDDISPIDMERVQQLTADFMRAENCRRPGAQQELAQGLHYVLKPYNTFSSSLLLKVRLSPRCSRPTLDPARIARLIGFSCTLPLLIARWCQRVEATIGCHVCAFFHECSRKCRYQHGGYSWNHEKLAWKVCHLR